MLMADRAHLLLLLHAHLPYVRRPDLPAALEEDWLFEAITETYIPLLDMFERLGRDGVAFRVALSISPTLCEMLRDPLLIGRYRAHMKRSIDLAEDEAKRHRRSEEMAPVTRMYRDWFNEADRIFNDRYEGDLLSIFCRLAAEGSVELITTAATHAYLPLTSRDSGAARAQVKIAVQYFKKIFGSTPAGFWLPECGYSPGLENILAENGIKYFFLDAHGLLNAKPPSPRGTIAPIATENGLAVFGRDLESSRLIWHPESGYPGAAVYRDFYRDQGYELEMEQLKDYLAPYGHRKMTGLKYHKITGGGQEKDIYDPEAARAQAVAHAEHFYHSRLDQAQAEGAPDDSAPPIFVAPFDAELFGHWWFEGPIFLEALIRKAAQQKDGLKLITPSEYLGRHRPAHTASPAASSWGLGGHSQMWLDPSNDWIYRHLHRAEDKMTGMARLYGGATGALKRALD
ncbi:MAG: DUF1957 domain-containing protein, partial [Nitrospinota bacterium]|nr:DUF1957 domain-containing protein [Nitrospinota bacterium]